MNSEFERWIVKQTFSGLDTPLSDGTKRLMEMAYEGGRKWQADKDATVIEALNELESQNAPQTKITAVNSTNGSRVAETSRKFATKAR